jgi:hypothetical protein
MSSIPQETRTGFCFNNPDITNNYHAPKWGLLVSPDDLRYDELFGNPLIAEQDNVTFTDDQLLDYARMSIRVVENELNIDILPRLIRYDDPIGENGIETARTDINDSAYLSQMDRKQQKELYIRESGYPYRIIAARQESRVKLRRRPVRDVLIANFVDPYYNNTVIDLMPYRIVKKDFSGVCYFRPRQSNSYANQYIYIWQNYFLNPYNRNFQSIFMIDYTTGYENCQDVPDELRYIIKKIAAITLMATYGDGKMSAVASRSVNLNSVSESISTTMSATSAAFGARMLQYDKQIKDWFRQNRSKYSRTTFGVLGQ